MAISHSLTLCVQENLPRMFEIPVRRNHIFEDSHRATMTCKNRDHLKARLWVKFEGEVGLDYGGVSRSVAPGQGHFAALAFHKFCGDGEISFWGDEQSTKVHVYIICVLFSEL